MPPNFHVLVTGAAGFIGSHVAEQCLKLGFIVTATDDLSGGFLANVPSGCEFIRGDLRDAAFVSSLWEGRRFDIIYHLGAYAAEGLSHFVRRFNYETNLVASINLINEAVNHGASCFVFTSSIAVYGAGQTPMSEDMTPQPEDPYGVSKYAVELDLTAAHEMFGLDFVIFRPHNVYGERQNIADKYRNVIGIFMNQVMQGQPMSVFGDGSQTRAFSHVDDVAPIIARSPLVAEARNQIFNVGADTAYSVKELAEEIACAFGVSCQLQHLEARQEVLHAFSDHAKVQRVFSPPPAVKLGDGLRRMVRWVRAQGPATPVRFGNIEISKNLPASWRS
ncbi:NAD-dependent epimerase/dehydratase family protein [Prosthecobacter sp.]|uniref:NAD-dependent epimerase/dehydratase family protein n=1 Tax=Prosthecobacter sp. TaxID=1965333 RepID=UPI003784769D